MSYKIFLSPSDQDRNLYAYGNTNEAVQCGKIADACKVALERNGFKVKIGHMISMADKVAQSDAFGADLHVPIHTNACNGSVMGTRLFCYNKSGEGYKACSAIMATLAPITPGTSDSISVADFYEILNPKAPTVYVEGVFHDSVTEAKWCVEHTTEMGEAIAKGICNYFGVKYKTATVTKPKTTKKELYRVRKSWANVLSQIGAYSVLENAIKACKPGYKVFNSKGKVVYSAAKKSVTEIAKEVIAGKWGNGATRKAKLTAAGYNYNEVQKQVNKLLAPTKKSIDKVAREVIAGKWGNGAERKKRLTAAGYDYDAVQKRVNEIL